MSAQPDVAEFSRIPTGASLVWNPNHPYLRGKDIFVIVLKRHMETRASEEHTIQEIIKDAKTICKPSFEQYMKKFNDNTMETGLRSWSSRIGVALKLDNLKALNDELADFHLTIVRNDDPPATPSGNPRNVHYFMDRIPESNTATNFEYPLPPAKRLKGNHDPLEIHNINVIVAKHKKLAAEQARQEYLNKLKDAELANEKVRKGELWKAAYLAERALFNEYFDSDQEEEKEEEEKKEEKSEEQ